MRADANILVTGANGFIGRNLIAELRNQGFFNILEYDVDTEKEKLDEYAKKASFIFHLAGVNRPKSTEEFMIGNYKFTLNLLEKLKSYNNKAPILLTSSIQAKLANPYGESKKAGEDLLLEYGRKMKTKVFVFRLANVFGKWCRPNYNSVVATFCYNISNGLPIKISDRNIEIGLCYIDDVVKEFIRTMDDMPSKEDDYCKVDPVHFISLGRMADLLYEFKDMKKTLDIPDLRDPLIKKLHATYLSYLPKDDFAYPLKMNIDERGSFTEILRTMDKGQFSVNISKPGITKGNHWHHTKNEKFVVVSGSGLIKFRRIGIDEIIEYHVTGDNMQVVDIPVGYTHCIINEGETDLITFMWCNECFDAKIPDTYYENVEGE